MLAETVADLAAGRARRAGPGWCEFAVQPRRLRPGRVLPVDRRTHQRQRQQGIPRRDAGQATSTTASRSPGRRRVRARTSSMSASTTSAATAPQDMTTIAGELATASTLPIVLDSTETAVLRAGLESLAGRCIINSVNFEDGDGPDSTVLAHDGTGPRARCGRHRPDHRRAGPGPNGRSQARGGPTAGPAAHRRLGHERRRHPARLPDVHRGHRSGGEPTRRAGDHRGDPAGQEGDPRGPHHARPVERELRAQPGRTRGAELGVPARVRGGRSGLGDRARGQDHADQPHLRRAARGRARPDLRPTPRPGPPGRCLRPAAAPARTLRRREVGRRQGQQGGRTGGHAGGRTTRRTHRRRRPQGPGARPRRGADLQARLGDHQRLPAGRHAHGGGAVRLGSDAAAVRAAVAPR